MLFVSKTLSNRHLNSATFPCTEASLNKMSKLDDFSDLDDLHLLEGLSLQEIEELSEAIDPEVRTKIGL